MTEPYVHGHPTHVLTPDAAAAAGTPGHAPAGHPATLHPDVVVPSSLLFHTIVGFILSFGGLFVMMTVAFAAYGAALAMIGVSYTLAMWMTGLARAESQVPAH